MMMRFLVVVCVLVLPVSPLLAQVDSNQFIITFWGGADTTPPPTPAISSVTPVTDTQIDVVWGAVVDDMALAGYVVFRDGLPVATTTLTNYSDTGLLASTTYSYFVRAFDGAYNYSSSSAAVATTTLPTPPPPPVATSTPSSGGSSGTIARPVLNSIIVTPGTSTTSISVGLAMPTRIEIRWGQTLGYELGASVGSVYRRDHKLLITDLTPRTTYYYEVVGITPSGVSAVLESGSFVTLGTPTIISPANVERFTATADGSDVDLSWRLPSTVPNATVRIVRNYYGFPAFPTDGAVVYQGSGDQFTDTGVLSVRSPVYYTAFVYDSDGNVSSGAVVMVVSPQAPPSGIGQPDTPVTAPTIPEDVFVTEATSSTEVARSATPPVVVPTLNDIYVLQGERKVSLAEADITLDSTLPITLSIPKDKVGGAFKSIIGTIVDPTDTRKEFSFLLRVNQDQTAYEAVIAPINVLGVSTLAISIYNYSTLIVASYKAPITFIAPEHKVDGSITFVWLWWIWILILVLLLWWLFGVRAKLREDNSARS